MGERRAKGGPTGAEVGSGAGSGPSGRAREVRALQIFKDVIDLPVGQRARAVAERAAGDDALAAAVDELLAHDARADALVAGQGQELLAADMMMSMLGRGEGPGASDEPHPEHIGPYRVLRVLGRGGMGVVYEAEQATPRRRVAIKTVHPWLRSPALAERFAFEVQTLASLRHRAIPRLYEVREELGATWMVMELVHGVPIARWKEGRPLVERLELLLEVLDAVHHAHLAGIAHRDLKPGNILVDDGHARVLDFGLAAPLDASQVDPRGRDPASSGLAGTLAYMAPEQLEAGAVPDARSDTYALGILCHELLTGELPVTLPAGAPSISAIRAAKRAASPPSPSTRVAELRDDIDYVLARALAVDPDARYPTVAAFADDLRRYLALRPVGARPASLGYRLALGARRHRGLVRAVVATLATVLAVVGIVALVRGLEAEAERGRVEERAVARLSALDARQRELLARGAVDEADAQFELFARMDENVGTRALYDAWVRRAARQGALGRTEEEVRAYGGAYAAAVDDADRRTALQKLGEAFLAAGRWDGLSQVVSRLDELGAGDVPTTRALSLAVHAYRRDAAGVARAADASPAGPAVAALLAGARPLGVVATNTFELPAVREGGARFLVLDQRSRALIGFGGGAAPGRLTTVPLPDDVVFGGAFPRLAGPGLDIILSRTAAGGRWFRWDRPDETLGAVTMASLYSNTAHWVNGRLEAVVGSAGGARRLGVLPDLTAGAEPRWAPPEVVGPPSDVDDLLVADLDGDGEDELIAALGAWSTYDLRVFRFRPNGGLSLLARRRVGATSQLALLPRSGGRPLIVIGKGLVYANPTLLGPEHPYGLPAGLHLFSLEGDTLEPRGYIPTPPPIAADAAPFRVLVGDVDGDGLADLVIGATVVDVEVALVARQVAPLEFALAFLGDVDPQLIADVDGDGDDELVARFPDDADRGWVLGLGDTPPRPLPAAPRRPVPERLGAGGDPALERSWRSALELAAMGLGRAAAEELDALAQLAAEPTVKARLIADAADLWLDGDEAERAARGYESALAVADAGRDADGAHRERLTLGAARAWLAAHVVDRARDRFAALRDEGGATGAEARAALTWLEPVVAREAPPLDVIAGGRLHGALVLQAPEALTRDRTGGGAWVDTYSDGEPVAELPVRYDGGRIGIGAVLDVVHLEIGSGLSIALVPAGGGANVLEIEVQATGGGLSIRRSAHCGPWDRRADPTWLSAAPSASAAERITLDLDYLPGADDTRCVITSGEARTERVDRRYRSPAITPGDYRVVLRPREGVGWEAVMWARVGVRELTLRGLAPRAVAVDARARANRAFYDGRLGEAAAAYAVAGDPVDLLLVALARGDADTAQAAAAAIGEAWGARGGRGGHLLRSRPGDVAPLVEALGGDLFARAYRRAWDVALRYLDTPETQRGLMVPALDALTGRSEDELTLIAARVRLRLRDRDGALALALAEGALDVAASRAPPEGDVAARITELELLAAAAADQAGDGDGARRHLLRWLAAAPEREAALETLRNQPQLAPLEAYLDE